MVDFTGTVTAPAEQVNVTVPAETMSLPVEVPQRLEVGTTTERVLVATVSVDTTNLKTLLRLTGWPEDKIDMAQAIATAESRDTTILVGSQQQLWADAVGDITLVSAIWGPSIGLFQIRSLKAPEAQNSPSDLWRQRWALRRAFFNCEAALAISKGGTDWTQWSVFTSKSYEQFLGGDPVIKTGHSRAAEWWK